jgi:beta-lactamase class A
VAPIVARGRVGNWGLSVLSLILGVQVCGQTLDQKIKQASAGFHGAPSLFAKNLDTGVTYGLRENERVRTASTIKLAIMVTVFDAVEHGHAKWTDKLTLRDSDKVAGTGVLSEFSDGMQFPIRDLVHLMIVVSDNTATNLLLDRFTADAVNAEMDALGLKDTRCLRKVLIGGKAPSGVSQAGKLAENQRFGLGVSTSREMVSLIEKMEQGELVNAAASREMIAILKRQQDRNGISRRTGDLPVADKTGSLDHLRSDVGIVYSPGGRLAIAITVDDLPDVNYSPDNTGGIFISRLTGLLLEGLAKHENQRDAHPR